MSTVPAQTIEGRRRIKAARAKKCEHTVVKDGQPGVCDRPIVDTVDEVCDRPGDHEETP